MAHQVPPRQSSSFLEGSLNSEVSQGLAASPCRQTGPHIPRRALLSSLFICRDSSGSPSGQPHGTDASASQPQIPHCPTLLAGERQALGRPWGMKVTATPSKPAGSLCWAPPLPAPLQSGRRDLLGEEVALGSPSPSQPPCCPALVPGLLLGPRFRVFLAPASCLGLPRAARGLVVLGDCCCTQKTSSWLLEHLIYNLLRLI